MSHSAALGDADKLDISLATADIIITMTPTLLVLVLLSLVSLIMLPLMFPRPSLMSLNLPSSTRPLVGTLNPPRVWDPLTLPKWPCLGYPSLWVHQTTCAPGLTRSTEATKLLDTPKPQILLALLR